MSKLTLVPISGSGNRVFVKVDTEAVKQSQGGIFMVQDTKEHKPNEGMVTHVSAEDINGKAPTVAVGDRILFSEFAGLETNFRGETFLVMKEVDIQAIIK